MRPIALRLIAFRSYADTTVDFRHHGLVVVTGDTGAGKTSILDGICFALFAKTPELGGARELLTLGATHGEVVLTFRSGGDTWRVTRRFGREAPEPAHLLERIDDGSEPVERVIGATTVNERVVHLIGMTFQAFTSAVLLAQGRFAQFLQSSPRERDAILRELFGITGLETVRTTAVAHRDAHLAAAATLDAEGARLGARTTAAYTQVARAARQAAATHAALRGLEPTVATVIEAEASAAMAETLAQEIGDAVSAVGDADTRARLRDAHAELRADVARMRAALSATEDALASATAAHDQRRTTHGGGSAHLTALRTQAERLTELRTRLPEAEREREARADEVQRSRDALVAGRERHGVLATGRTTREQIADAIDRALAARAVARETTERLATARHERDTALHAARTATDEASFADQALDELRHAHMADRLRGELAAGAPCPVCGQLVHEPPPVPEDDLADVETGVATLQERAATLTDALAAAEARLRAAELHDATARTAAADAAARLASVGGGADDDEAVAQRLRGEVARAADEEGRLGDEIAALAARIERETGSLEETDRGLARDRADRDALLAELGGWATHDDPAGALGAAVDELSHHEAAVLSATRAVAEAAGALRTAQSSLTRFEHEHIASLRQATALLADRVSTSIPAADLDATDLLELASALAERAHDAHREARAVAKQAHRLAADMSATIAATGAPFGVHAAADLQPRLLVAASELAARREALGHAAHTGREAARLAARARGERREADVWAQLAVDLQANRFPRFLLGRFHERLAGGATTRLGELSHGAFSFTGTEPDHLAVVDHRRGNLVRSAATLSGGERFLASLALALSLSEIASGTEGRLECLFLDEGFSSLDADSLELAITGVERMADDGRLVVVITHLPGVAERLGAAIHVRKDTAGTSHVIDLVTATAERSAVD